jgi:NADH-quinone oxidoreductase subunit M
MNYGLLGLFSLTTTGIMGSYLLSIFHGFVSALLFIIIGMIYERYHTRNIFYIRAITIYAPILSVIFFLGNLANMGFPGTANFIGEVMIFMGVFESNIIVGITCLIPLFFTVIYSFWLFTRTSMGNYQKFKFLPVTKINDVSRRELLIAFPLIIITIILGIKPQLLMDLVDNSINLIYYKYEYETSRNIY